MVKGSQPNRDEIRAALIAKIRATWPHKLPDAIERDIALGNITDLRRHLVWAQALADMEPLEPQEREPLEPPGPSPSPHLNSVRVCYAQGYGYPSHTYVLAKDECAGMDYAGPEWAPFNLWHQCEYGAPGPNPARTKECARLLLNSAGAHELWNLIAERYEWPGNVAAALPQRCAEYLDHWQATPKVTPSEHREARMRLQRHANQLATELARFFDRWDYDEEPGEINFTQLLSQPEQDEMNERIRQHNHRLRNKALKDAGVRARDYDEYVGDFDPERPISPWNPSPSANDTGDTLDLIFSIVPTLPDIMQRIAKLFADDGQLPPLQRPGADNAERNFFTRNLIRYFLREHGDMSPTIVASIVSIFFAQGITVNEVSKQVAYLPDGRRMPWKHETSPSK